MDTVNITLNARQLHIVLHKLEHAYDREPVGPNRNELKTLIVTILKAIDAADNDVLTDLRTKYH